MDAIPVNLRELMEAKHDTVLEKFRGVEQRFMDNEKAVSSALTSQQREVSAALASAERAVTKAEVATEKRFDGVNEFRAQLADQSRTYIPRSEVEARLLAISEKSDTATAANSSQIASMRIALENLAGRRGGISDGIGWIVAACAVIGLVATMLFHR